jgi:hypothetical protein
MINATPRPPYSRKEVYRRVESGASLDRCEIFCPGGDLYYFYLLVLCLYLFRTYSSVLTVLGFAFTVQHTQTQTSISRDSSNRAVPEPCLRTFGHCDRHSIPGPSASSNSLYRLPYPGSRTSICTECNMWLKRRTCVIWSA